MSSPPGIFSPGWYHQPALEISPHLFNLPRLSLDLLDPLSLSLSLSLPISLDLPVLCSLYLSLCSLWLSLSLSLSCCLDGSNNGVQAVARKWKRWQPGGGSGGGRGLPSAKSSGRGGQPAVAGDLVLPSARSGRRRCSGMGGRPAVAMLWMLLICECICANFSEL